MSQNPPPVGEDVRLLCARCGREVGKMFGKLYWRIKESFPMFCVYHPQCEGLKMGEILQLPDGTSFEGCKSEGGIGV